MNHTVKYFSVAIILAIHLSLSGCTDKEPVYQSIYHGLQFIDQQDHPTEEQTNHPEESPPNYDQYKRERQEILQNEGSEN